MEVSLTSRVFLDNPSRLHYSAAMTMKQNALTELAQSVQSPWGDSSVFDMFLGCL